MSNAANAKSIRNSIISSVLLILAYIITYKFYVTWWFVIDFVDLVVAIFYLISTIGNIAFMIGNRKKYKYSFLQLSINLICILVVIFLPPIYSNKDYPNGTGSLCERKMSNCNCNLYFDYYCEVMGSATETDLNAVYLTDHKNFKIYIGTYDEGDLAFDAKCNGDLIKITKYSNKGIEIRWTPPIIIEQKSFSLKELIMSHKFD